ncbi:MAG: PadR family transcriptional regulator [Ktedonobacterales bacterium]
MTKKSSLAVEHALLGLLRQQPMHAYEMYQRLMQAEALGLVWHLKQSHLYALLARLEEDGFIAGTTEPQGMRPPKRVLRLTPSGQAAFEEWVTTPVAHGRDFRLEFLAKLFFALEASPQEAAALIARQRAACPEWLDELDAQEGSMETERPYNWLVVQFRRSQIEAILGWLDTCAATLGAR